MINEHCVGTIKDITPGGDAIIIAPLPNLEKALDRKYSDVEVIFNDGRRITSEQRRKCFSLISEIAEFVEGFRNAQTIEETKEQMKWSFILERMEDQERRLFSLSDCSVTIAKNFIDYLVSFIIRNDIPSSISLLDNCEDVSAYVYASAINKKCCICGQAAQLHHTEGSRIGIGNDRTKVHHLGRECLPLCEKHHAECHQDEKGFIKKHHLEVIKIDERICKTYRLRK